MGENMCMVWMHGGENKESNFLMIPVYKKTQLDELFVLRCGLLSYIFKQETRVSIIIFRKTKALRVIPLNHVLYSARMHLPRTNNQTLVNELRLIQKL